MYYLKDNVSFVPAYFRLGTLQKAKRRSSDNPKLKMATGTLQ